MSVARAAARAAATYQRQLASRPTFVLNCVFNGSRLQWASSAQLGRQIRYPPLRLTKPMWRGYATSGKKGDGETGATEDELKDLSKEADPILPTDANVESLAQQEKAAASIEGYPLGTISSTPGASVPSEFPTVDSASRGGKEGDKLPKSAYVSSAARKRARIQSFSFAALIFLCTGWVIYLGRNWDTEEERKAHEEDAPDGWGIGLFYNRVKARLDDILNYYNDPVFDKLLPDPIPDPDYQRPYTLVLSLEDLLIHTEWDREHGWRTAKRPGLDYFLAYLSMYYEIVVFSDQPNYLALPVLEKLNSYPGFISHGLAREATRYQKGKYIKDLNHLNRDLSKVILIDTKHEAATLQPDNAIIIPPWKGDPKNRELVKLINFLEFVAAMGIPDVRPVITDFEGKDIPTEFALREAAARKKFLEKQAEEMAKKKDHAGSGVFSSMLGIKPPPVQEEKMIQDQIRERGQQQYKEMVKMVMSHKDKFEEEEKQRQKEMAEAMKTSLSKIFTEGLPKQPGQQ